jgi:hypothetical protein
MCVFMFYYMRITIWYLCMLRLMVAVITEVCKEVKCIF